MKKSANLTLQNELNVVTLSSPDQGELALVNISILERLLDAHAVEIPFREMRDRIIAKLQNCIDVEDYKKILAYDLSTLALYDNLKEYRANKLEQIGTSH